VAFDDIQSAMTGNSQIRSVQALRGIAALAVMLFHFRSKINYPSYPIGDWLFIHGAVGVDLFFVISGFIMVYTSHDTSKHGVYEVASFYVKRFSRVYPVLFVVLWVAFLSYGALSIFHEADKAQNFLRGFLVMPVYTDSAPAYMNDSGIVGVRWTLNYEMFFYLIFGLCLLLGKKRWIALYIGMSFFLIGLPVIAGKALTMNENVGYDFGYSYLNLITNPLIWEFMLGTTVALVYPFIRKYKGYTTRALLVASTVYCVWVLMGGYRAAHGVLNAGLPFALLLLFILIEEETVDRYTPEILVKLGGISFSLYMVHTSVGTRLTKFIEDLAGPGYGEGFAIFFAESMLSIYVAYILYLLVEKGLSGKVRNVLMQKLKARFPVESPDRTPINSAVQA
jgi:exopolysaccharide production protein ExoZ